MKKILLLFIALAFAVGCSKKEESKPEKVTLTVKLPYYKGADFSPVYLFYRTPETEKILNNSNYNFSFTKEAYINEKENITIKYHDKKTLNNEGIVVFENVPRDYAQIVFQFGVLGFKSEVVELLNLKEKTYYDFTKKD
ncbi:hypothetical protein ACIRNY_05135 [Capnocytophaga canimorsus]|uniref:hypothetical protein n=1 Tax=Capnocytophaga canimorsus TaxID=28188 RepID=UPI0037D67C24